MSTDIPDHDLCATVHIAIRESTSLTIVDDFQAFAEGIVLSKFEGGSVTCNTKYLGSMLSHPSLGALFIHQGNKSQKTLCVLYIVHSRVVVDFQLNPGRPCDL